ncbi:MAG: orotidine-5'-phosphate decarboxylase [Buchnera aphidicola (Eriosoma harunire)]
MSLLQKFKKTKIIVALDYTTRKDAMHLASMLDPSIFYLKIGKVMFTRFGVQLIEDLHKLKFKIFLDLKFHDIPNTVYLSVQAAADLGVWMLSVHLLGGINMLQAAKFALLNFSKSTPMLIGITMLTSFCERDLKNIGVEHSLRKQILLLARLADECGLDGIVCPGTEAKNIKNVFGNNLKIITPGIRMNNLYPNDQSQIITPIIAKKIAIDYIVIGRPVTMSPKPIDELNSFYSML